MKTCSLIKLAVICGLVCLCSQNALALRIVSGQWEKTWIEREKDFSGYMEDYIDAKAKGLAYTKKKKLLSKKAYKKKAKAFEAVKKNYAVVDQTSGEIRETLRSIDKEFKKGRIDTAEKQIKSLAKSQKRYRQYTGKLKGAEEIDKNEIKIANKALQHIADNIADQHAMFKNAKNAPKEGITQEESLAMWKKNAIPGMQNSIAQMKYALAKVKKKPTLKTWTGKAKIQDASRDVQMSLGIFKDDRQFKDAKKLQDRFKVYESQMAKMIKANINKPADEPAAVMDAYGIIKKDLKLLEKNFARYKKKIKYKK